MYDPQWHSLSIFIRDAVAGSLLDVTGACFVLLTGPDGAAWGDVAARVAAGLGVTLRVHRPGPGGDLLVADPSNVTSSCGIGPNGAALVRPDGVLAWSSHGAVDDPERVLDEALRSVLGRPVAAAGEVAAAGRPSAG